MQAIKISTPAAPALEKYAAGPLTDLWKRPGLSPRDRSIVTVAVLIARNQTNEMPRYFNLALDSGVNHFAVSVLWRINVAVGESPNYKRITAMLRMTYIDSRPNWTDDV